MFKRLLALDGVLVVCQFRDDGELAEGYGVLDERLMRRMAKFAHDYKRMVQGNTDQFSMFTRLSGWAPPGGWIVRGDKTSVCSVGNLVCFIDNAEASLNEVMRDLTDASRY
jgi:roadblock/LC7 domain-containing protein